MSELIQPIFNLIGTALMVWMIMDLNNRNRRLAESQANLAHFIELVHKKTIETALKQHILEKHMGCEIQVKEMPTH